MNNSYNQLNNAPDMPYNIISKLLSNNEDLWKLLKYNESNALSRDNLTDSEKRELIYSGGEIADGFKVFTNILYPDESFNEQQSQLRVAIDEVSPSNYVYSNIKIMFQVLSHSNIITLDNYQSRTFRIVNEIVKTLNGTEIGGIGNLTMNRTSNIGDGIKMTKFNKYFNGYIISMSVNST